MILLLFSFAQAQIYMNLERFPSLLTASNKVPLSNLENVKFYLDAIQRKSSIRFTTSKF